jgi:hypothetical protein
MTDAATFADLIAGSHTARFAAIVPHTFQTGTDPQGEPLPIIGGSITFDATADVWASGDLTVSAAWPGPRDETITVFGGEVFLARGVETGAGGVAWSPLGYFRISETNQDDAARGPIRLTLDDRMMTIIESRLIFPRVYEPGTTVQEAVEDLVLDVYPNAVIEFESGSGATVIERQVTVEENRFDALVDFADGLGQIAYFDERGVLLFRNVPDETEPVWTVRAGSGGVQVNASRKLTRDKVYNAVVARGEGMDDIPPVQAVAYDAGPTSPTRWGGPFGMIPRFYASPFITTAAQARETARALLQRSIGAPYTVSLSVIPNPAMRPYDPIRVIYNDDTRELHTVDKFTLPFDVTTAAGIATREQTTTYVRVE